MMTINIILVIIAVHLAPMEAADKQVGVCYYGDWALYRKALAGVGATKLNPHICTHIIVSFIRVDGNKLNYFNCDQKTALDDAVKLKKQNSDLKVMVAVGGYNHGSPPFSRMSKAKNGPAQFAESTVTLLNRHNLDGLDVDWEYPTNQKKGFSAVIKALRKAFDEEETKSGKRLLLTAAVTANKNKASSYYEYDVMGRVLDYVFIMAYDFHGHWDDKTGHQSALRGDKDNFDVSSAALHYRDEGVPIEKIVIGFPTYGRTFRLKSKDVNGLGAPAISDKGPAGPYTREQGTFAYFEICSLYLARGTPLRWDSTNMASYLYKDTTWVSFDSKQAICNKLKWLHENGFSGWMVWTVDMDDHANMCSEGNYPLITYLKNNVGKKLTASDCSGKNVQSNAVNNKNIHTGTNAKTGDNGPCKDKEDGFYIHPDDCSKFIQCYKKRTAIKHCGSGLKFSAKSKTCDWPTNVDCTGRTSAMFTEASTTVTVAPTAMTTALLFIFYTIAA